MHEVHVRDCPADGMKYICMKYMFGIVLRDGMKHFMHEVHARDCPADGMK